MKENVTAVIRGANERTEKLCYYLLSKQLSEKNIFVVHKVPSTEGTRAVYTIGLEQGRKWTLFVDADQLLLPGSVSFLYQLAEAQPRPAFGVKGTVRDKLFMEQRGMGCGPIMYYTKAFDQAIKYIPDPYQAIRPDSFIIGRMKDRHGYTWIRNKKCVALHDYGQFYKHIYKKMYINATKMDVKCRLLYSRWLKLSATDNDFKVCVQGYLAGSRHQGKIAIDYSKDFGYNFSIPEKEPIQNFEIIRKKMHEGNYSML